MPGLLGVPGLCAHRERYHGWVMKITETAAGTPVVVMTAEEEAAYLERQVQREMSMSVAEFTQAYLAGEFDDMVPDVDDIIGLLRISQNGQSAAA